MCASDVHQMSKVKRNFADRLRRLPPIDPECPRSFKNNSSPPPATWMFSTKLCFATLSTLSETDSASSPQVPGGDLQSKKVQTDQDHANRVSLKDQANRVPLKQTKTRPTVFQSKESHPRLQLEWRGRQYMCVRASATSTNRWQRTLLAG